MPTTILKICPVCKKQFNVEIKRINAGQGIYCSNSCAGKVKNHKPVLWVLVPLTRGKFAKVDVENVLLIAPHSWQATPTTYGTYRAETHINKKVVRMHRFIMNAPAGKDIHHKNGNTLDNRKCNLLVCSRSEHFKIGGKHKPPIYYGEEWKKIHGKR
ncbi:hypothetical protein LCGC14_0979900 [marine sediment metagenome]|uniref:HNH nuclease domain-containing protein n=1 Tax=marine sediment metagenome TaxID=412755 RepID=A0A0F9RFJ3_9ZZZZ